MSITYSQYFSITLLCAWKNCWSNAWSNNGTKDDNDNNISKPNTDDDNDSVGDKMARPGSINIQIYILILNE